jgi:FlaA1/EpsC-like NDP-sugar epimerase
MLLRLSRGNVGDDRSSSARRPARDLTRTLRFFVAETVARLRGRHLFLLDTAGILIASWVAMSIRRDTFVQPEAAVPFAFLLMALVLAVRTMVDIRFGLYRHDWRYASVPDLQRIVLAVVAGTIVAAGLLFVMDTLYSQVAGAMLSESLPRSFWLTEILLTLTFVGGSRFGIRALHDFASLGRSPARPANDALLYGAGSIGAMIARSARRVPQAGVLPRGFLDDDPALAGKRVAGLPVYGGLEALASAVAATGANTLLITASNASGASIRRIMDAATALRLEVRTVPSMVELLDGTVDAHRVRKVRVEDLLRRPTTTEHASEVAHVFPGKVVLITGAGGSIGSELARQVMALRPRRVILLDRAESALFDIHRQLAEAYAGSTVELHLELANVSSRAAIQRIVERERPDVILHAAAYKHVPMMEQHPSDAIHVNVAGTMALLDAAAEAGVDRFVLVSTDKAVKPSSVMGASKRLAEMLVADTARRTGRPYVSVRFGNVLGSNGSVVPIFTDQLERGRPLTITHPDMTRYFMTIPEASWLILDAAALGRAGDLFVLDMGEPVRIIDLARDVTRLAGRDPDSQPIEFTGLRPGEKLHEELFYAQEQALPTTSPKVLRVAADEPPTDIRACVGRLLEFATGTHDEDLRAELSRIVGGIQGPPESEADERVAVPIMSERVRQPMADTALAKHA